MVFTSTHSVPPLLALYLLLKLYLLLYTAIFTTIYWPGFHFHHTVCLHLAIFTTIALYLLLLSLSTHSVPPLGEARGADGRNRTPWQSEGQEAAVCIYYILYTSYYILYTIYYILYTIYYTVRLREMGTELMGTILRFASVPPRKMGTLLLGSWWPWQCVLPTLYCIESRPNLELASGNCES